jgi:tetratricopeptide (TPR) repeat protein/serine/threonine protein kinase
MPVDPPRVKDLFVAALELPDAQARQAFLERACGGDATLRQRVQLLLQAHDAPASVLDRPLAEVAPVDPAVTGPADPANPALAPAGPPPESAGMRIAGRYQLLEAIGEGGMGAVWMAQQTEPVKRLVAVKLIKAGMDSHQVLARFEAERQALALMDHPNIAKVLDAGAAPDGRPFFVMELVKGVPITRYCDEHRLTPRQRLELFVPVCQAVQHAHQKGVIHRDVKPSNVLVARYDDRPVPKVIDFGVAKATGQQLTEQTLHTGFGAVVGTLEYMSPEQASFNQLDIDTRSDIYSLGVLLYELLAGSPPFTREELEKAGVLEMLRVIREQEPSKPSTKLSTAEGLPTLAANRGTEPAKLTRLVRGDLDWIVMKSLEKDRNRRYETANGLARDIERYLADEPVQAGPPSAWYRFRKFARRNKRSLATVTVVALAVLLVIGTLGWVARDRAARQREAERAVTAALAQAETLLAEGYKQADHPERWLATARLAQAALEKAEGLLAAGAGTDELTTQVRQVRAAVEAAVTDSRLLLELDRIRLEAAAVVKDGRYDKARAAPLYAKALGDYGVEVAAPEAAAARVRASRLREALLAALHDWARVTREEGARQRLEAVLQAVEPPDAFRTRWQAAARRGDKAALVQLAAEPQVQQLPAADIVHLGQKLAEVKEWAAAERLLRAAQERKPADFWLNHNLGMVLDAQGPLRAEEAVGYLRAALALRSDSPGVYLNLGRALSTKEDLDSAMRCYQAALQIDPNYAMAHTNLGFELYQKGDEDGAIRCWQAAIRIDPNHGLAHLMLGGALGNKGRLDEAIAELQKGLGFMRADAEGHYNLGWVLQRQGKLDDAIAAFREAIRLKQEFPKAYHNLGALLCDYKKDYDGAIAAFQEVLRLKPDDLKAQFSLGNALSGKGRLDEAIDQYQKVLRLKPDYPEVHCNLGSVLRDKGRLDEAIAELQKATRSKQVFPEAYKAHTNLGDALSAKDRLDEAIAEYRKAIKLKEDYPEAHCNLGNRLRKKGDLDAAIREYRAALQHNPKLEEARLGLGRALLEKKDLDGAIRELRTAVQVNPQSTEAHNGLGIGLKAKGDLDGAIREYRVALRVDPNNAQARCNLGTALVEKGLFHQAVEELRLGHQLGSQDPRWPYRSEQWLRNAERMVDLDAKLAKVLRGETPPVDAGERTQLGWLCQQPYKLLNAAAARFYAEAFAAEPKLADDLGTGHRYNAACAAALAAAGHGRDADKLDDQQRARLRRQALTWLRADLAAWRALLDKDPNKAGPAVLQTMQHWQGDADFASVRGPEALARLPEAERPQWQELWQEVAALQKRAAGSQ